jgi:hypothetical protein
VGEVKVLLAREKALRPRTYRIGGGKTLFLGGVARIDVDPALRGTIYMTVWATDLIPLHMGKTESADAFWERNVGGKLYPPFKKSKDLVPELSPVEVRSFMLS